MVKQTVPANYRLLVVERIYRNLKATHSDAVVSGEIELAEAIAPALTRAIERLNVAKAQLEEARKLERTIKKLSR